MTTTKKPQAERHLTMQEQGLFHKALRRSVKPQAERVCECGHPQSKHSRFKIGCIAGVETSMRGGYECCPCPAFTPKKEEKRDERYAND